MKKYDVVSESIWIFVTCFTHQMTKKDGAYCPIYNQINFYLLRYFRVINSRLTNTQLQRDLIGNLGTQPNTTGFAQLTR